MKAVSTSTPNLRDGLRLARLFAHEALDRVAFAAETVAIATVLLLLLSYFVVRGDWIGTTHEWGQFWSHYAAASPSARQPVNEVLLGVMAVLTLGVGACRIAVAREHWRSRRESAVSATPNNASIQLFAGEPSDGQ